ncbi:Purple acid phosphatase [Heracleum sosnowskyi]|uniref:Purple acid phosphatase n=1 Tax=Heracleum sosnowskyi TaxID=360622 RepID=A0AAD8MN59_9APIA|nr:Purple acid phosphatase [Heracleum sosnowskyi]
MHRDFSKPSSISCFGMHCSRDAIILVEGEIPTTLEGPFKPVTVPLDDSFRGNAVDLPDTDERLQRTVYGFEPEQISVSLFSTYDSVSISWITGDFQIGDNIKPLNPKSVANVVRYGRSSSFLKKRAKGNSLIYNQIYPFEGLRNYTSGIIHHVKLIDDPKPDRDIAVTTTDCTISSNVVNVIHTLHAIRTWIVGG